MAAHEYSLSDLFVPLSCPGGFLCRARVRYHGAKVREKLAERTRVFGLVSAIGTPAPHLTVVPIYGKVSVCLDLRSLVSTSTLCQRWCRRCSPGRMAKATRRPACLGKTAPVFHSRSLGFRVCAASRWRVQAGLGAPGLRVRDFRVFQEPDPNERGSDLRLLHCLARAAVCSGGAR